MKLDSSCVRDVLILCEDTPFLSEDLIWESVTLKYFVKHLPQYSKSQIAYTLIQLNDAEYINATIFEYDDGVSDIVVNRLTYAGHELIDTIRPEKVWQKISKSISEISNISLPILQEIGSHFLIEFLTHH